MFKQTQNEFLEEYLTRRHSILIELLKHESLPSRASCLHCQQSSGTHRCQDCFGSNLWCSDCCVLAHKYLPFHRVQMWNGQFFERSDVLAQQLTIDLCHYPDDCPTIPLNEEMQMMHDLDIADEGDGFECPPSNPSATSQGIRSNLIIVSSTGIFKRSIRWCRCATTSDQYVELLLRAKLFPASFKNPKTAFTFEVLDHFQIDALECKTAAMNFMRKIGRITNEAFPSEVPVSFSFSSDELSSLTIWFQD